MLLCSTNNFQILLLTANPFLSKASLTQNPSYVRSVHIVARSRDPPLCPSACPMSWSGSGQPSGAVGLCCTWSGSLCARAAVFLQAVCSLDKGYKQTNKPTAIWSMRTHLLGCHLCKMESQAKESWQSSSCIVKPRVKAVCLLELQLSKRKFQEDRNPLL